MNPKQNSQHWYAVASTLLSLPAITALNKNLFLQTSWIHCVKYFLEFGCIRKNDRRMSILYRNVSIEPNVIIGQKTTYTSHARNRENHVRQLKHVALRLLARAIYVLSDVYSPRARNSCSHPPPIDSLHARASPIPLEKP